MKDKIMPSIIALIVSVLVVLNQGVIVKAREIASNYAKGFIAVPADGSKGFNKDNLVALDASGKFPSDVLPASASAGGGGGLFYSCGPCPTGSIKVGDTSISRIEKGTASYRNSILVGNVIVVSDGYELRYFGSDLVCRNQRHGNVSLVVCSK